MRWIVLLILGVIPSLFAGGWIRVYETDSQYGGGGGHSVRQTTDGGYIIAGTRHELYSMDSIYVDLWLIKTDSVGDTMWTRTYGRGGQYWDEGLCVQQTSDGGYIVTGYTNGNDMYLAGDLWLLKTDEHGDTQWTRTFMGEHSYDTDKGYWVEQTSDGGYIVTGNMDRTYLWFLKTDVSGFKDWEKLYEWGDYWETGYCIRPTNDGGYIVASNMGLFKTDVNCDSQWLKPWISREVEQTLDGGYILPSGQNNDLWLIKTDEYGDTMWTQTYGDDDKEGGVSCQQTSDGGYIILGPKIIPKGFGENYNIWLVKTDANGDTLWTRTFGEEYVDVGHSVQQTTDGGYIISGSGSFGSWRRGVLLIKTDSLGYVGVEEPPPTPTLSNWEVVSAIGHEVVLRYHDKPGGFHAKIYDISGKKVAECHSNLRQGTITWGRGFNPGVYIIREDKGTKAKVVLIR